MLLLCSWSLHYAVAVSLDFVLCCHCVLGVCIMPSLCLWSLHYAVTVSLGFALYCHCVCGVCYTVIVSLDLCYAVTCVLDSGDSSAYTEISPPGSTFCADSYFSVHSTTRVTTVKDPGHSAKNAGGRLQLKPMYLTRVALCEVIRGTFAWCTQNAPRWQQFHVAPAMPAL